MLIGLNLTVYTASKETGVINTVETIGVSTSKVAELQHESVVSDVEESDMRDESDVVSVGIISGVFLILVCILTTFSLPIIRRCLQHTSPSDSDNHSEHVDDQVAADQAYTVYDKVDLLLPATQYSDSSLDTTFTGEAPCHQHHQHHQHQAKMCRVMMTVSCDNSQDSITCLHSADSNSRESIL